MRALALLLVMAAPAAAQEPPAFDAAPVDACLAENTGEDARPESCIGLAANACMEEPGGYSTVGMGYCLTQELDHWDGLLNAAYAEVMASAREADAELAELGSAAEKQEPALREMQRRWIAYRDAACVYERTLWGGGTGGSTGAAQCLLDLTARQALWLRGYQRQM
jgi:uncharacterized protein YecT (DUF1311 family)